MKTMLNEISLHSIGNYQHYFLSARKSKKWTSNGVAITR